MNADTFRAELLDCWAQSDEIFSWIADEHLHHQPIGLRHPILFYVGHLPAFAWNQIGAGVLGRGPFHGEFDRLFERGIDPAEAVAGRTSWPACEAVLKYRDEVRNSVLALIPEVLAASDDPLRQKGRILNLVIEHERMHHETLMYMFVEALPGIVRAPSRPGARQSGTGRRPAPVSVGKGRVTLGVDFDAIDFGWDNEFGHQSETVEAFRIDATPVRNSDWADFLKEQGSPTFLYPKNWTETGVKTISGPVPFAEAEGWPVQVSGLQARSYCAARGGRLPTEAELHHAAFGQPDGRTRRYPWGDTPPTADQGNVHFRHLEPIPTGSSPKSASAWGVEELVGNGWEWSSSTFGPLPGFKAYARTYPGYSADFFDGDHDVVFGASWSTDLRFLRPSFRNWYRRGYPYATTSFRVVYF